MGERRAVLAWTAAKRKVLSRPAAVLMTGVTEIRGTVAAVRKGKGKTAKP